MKRRRPGFVVRPKIMMWTAAIAFALGWGMMFRAYWNERNEITRLKTALQKTAVERDLLQQRITAYDRGVDLGPLLQKAQRFYPDAEKKRTEGLLWVDRESRTGVVTLGAVHGLKPGSRLTVYDDQRRVGEVRVRIPLDVVATVQPQNDTWAAFPKKYYTVRKSSSTKQSP